MMIKKLLLPFRILKYRIYTKKNISKIIKKCKKSNRKISVYFMVNDNTKWNAHSVYLKMKTDIRFDPHIFICRQEQNNTEKITRNSFIDDCSFFDSLKIPYISGFDTETGKDVSVLKFKPDIVMYIQPWGWIKGLYDLPTVAKNSITCYIPYSLPLCNDKNDNQLNFLLFISFFYLPSMISLVINKREMVNKAKNCIVTGYPKFDTYHEIDLTKNDFFKITKSTKKSVIYAPHHSFTNRLQFATFEWNGTELLEYAKMHTEISWVFKPHPRLKYELVNSGIMSIQQANDYYTAWESLPNSTIYNKGNYIELFAASDALITDCISFLGEYLPSGNPVLHLINPNSVGFNELGSNIVKSYYPIFNFKQLCDSIDSVILNNIDPLKEVRIKALQQVFPSNFIAADKIIEHIIQLTKDTGNK